MLPRFLQVANRFGPRVQQKMCGLINHMGPDADFTSLRQEMDAEYPSANLPQTHSFAINNLWTNIMVFKSEMEFVMIAGGTQGTIHTQGLINGWNNVNSNAVDAGASLQFAECVYAMRAELGNAFTPLRANWFLAGHSYGGAVCEAFAAIAKFRDDANIVGICTFGSPRPGTVMLQDRLQGVPIRRWFNDTDPVPNVPPHTLEAPLLHYVLPHRLAQGINHQVQPVGGRRIMPNGDVSLLEVQTLPLHLAEPSLALWLSSSNAYGAQAHGIGEYKRRFGLMVDQNSVEQQPGPDRSPPEPPTQLNQREISRVVDSALSQLQADAVPSTLPQVQAQVPRSARYTIHRRRGGWGIYLNGSLQAVAKHHGTARTMMREGNARLANAAR